MAEGNEDAHGHITAMTGWAQIIEQTLSFDREVILRIQNSEQSENNILNQEEWKEIVIGNLKRIREHLPISIVPFSINELYDPMRVIFLQFIAELEL